MKRGWPQAAGASPECERACACEPWLQALCSAASPLTPQAGWAAGREGAAEATVRLLLLGFQQHAGGAASRTGGETLNLVPIRTP